MRDTGLAGIALEDREHVCVFYRGAEERDTVLGAFFRAGYAEGDKCLCIADDHDPAAVTTRLDPDQRRGPDQLTVLPSTAYLTDGRFEPQRVYDRWHSVIGDYVAAGYRHVRGSGELSWFLRQHRAEAEPAALLEYEALCNRLVKRRPATIFCLYDLDLLDAGLLPGVLRHHPAAIANGALFRAPWGVDERPAGAGGALHLAEQLVAGARTAGEVTALLAGVRRAVLEAEDATRLARRLFDGEPLVATDETTLRAFGVDVGAPARVVVMRPPAEPGTLAAHGIRLTATAAGRDEVSFVVSTDTDEDGDADGRGLASLATEGRTIGVGRARTGPAGIARSHAEARRAAEFAERLGRPVVHHEELGILALLADGGDPGAMAGFVEEWLGPLVVHDDSRSQKLLPTLAAFLDAGGAQQATADALGVHVSTLKYRLGRIETVIGRDLSAPDVRFQLQVALAVQRALAVL